MEGVVVAVAVMVMIAAVLAAVDVVAESEQYVAAPEGSPVPAVPPYFSDAAE